MEVNVIDQRISRMSDSGGTGCRVPTLTSLSLCAVAQHVDSLFCGTAPISASSTATTSNASAAATPPSSSSSSSASSSCSSSEHPTHPSANSLVCWPGEELLGLILSSAIAAKTITPRVASLIVSHIASGAICLADSRTLLSDDVLYAFIRACADRHSSAAVRSVDAESTLISPVLAPSTRSIDLSWSFCFSEKALCDLCASQPPISHLKLVRTTGVSDAVLELTAKSSGATLVSVDISRCPNVTYKGVAALAAMCHEISEFTAFACNKLDDQAVLSLATLPNLQELSLGRCSLITNAAVSQLISSCTSLTSLCLSRCRKLSYQALIQLKSLTALTSLDLSYLNVENLGDVLFALKNLRILYLSNSVGVTDTVLKSVAEGCTGLTRLFLSTQLHITDVGVKSILCGCPELQRLNLSNCSTLTEASFDVQGPLNLNTLNLSHCTNVSPGMISKLGPMMHTLELSHCKRLTVSTTIPIIAINFPSIRLLDLSASALDSDSFDYLTAMCSLLQWLIITETKILDSDLPKLSRLSHLELFNVSWCPNLTPIAMTLVLQHAPRITRFDATFCPLFTSQNCTAPGLRFIPHRVIEFLSLSGNHLHSPQLQFICALPYLQTLVLSGNDVDDETLSGIVQSCKGMQNLNITGCVKITDSSLVQISVHSVHLSALHAHGLPLITNKGVTEILLRCTEVMTLDFSGCDVTAEIFPLAQRVPGLSKLIVGHARRQDILALQKLRPDMAVSQVGVMQHTNKPMGSSTPQTTSIHRPNSL
ncbi:leucine Rich Repeat family protein [Pelomyxa schiedti]|nr:leucine Rich Repeat family protein [Pelomyxa schiedti]